MSLINQEISDFKVHAYSNGEFREIIKADVLGKWGVFFFYPADFTFVCPTEIAAFGKLIGSGVGPAEDERRAKWQGKRKPALDEDPDIQGSMHAASEEPTEEA